MPKKTNEKTHRLYLDYDEYRSGGDVCPGQENESWPLYENVYIDVEFKGIYRNMDNGPFFCDSFNVPGKVYHGDTAWLVVVYFNTGNTFGRTFGAWEAVDVAGSEEEALKLKTQIEADEYNYYGIEGNYKPKDAKYLTPWTGYFDEYQNTELYKFNIKDKYI